MKKGILLLFISNYKENLKELSYHAELQETECYSGTQTNDAPVKYLLHQAIKNGDIVQKILCITTKKVKESGDFDKFQEMVNHYIEQNESLKLLYQKVPAIEFCAVDYDNTLLETSKRAEKIYSQLSKYLFAEKIASVYIDYTGGLRDTSFLMITIIRYMEYHNMICKEIVYSNYENKTINSINCIYQMFQLLNGVDQFVQTGNAELLGKCYQQEEDAETKKILELLVQFSRTISLCDVKQIDNILPTIDKKLKQYEEKQKQGFFIEIFADLISIIRKKLYMEEEKTWGYPQIIRWCLDNNMLQQALTLYIEKMPIYYYQTKQLKLPIQLQKAPALGATYETAAFYTDLFESCLKDKKFKAFETALKNLNTKDPYFNLTDLQNIKKQFQEKEIQSAMDRLITFLKRYFENGVGKQKTAEEMPSIYDREPEKANSGIKYLNQIKNKPYLMHHFFYKNKELYEKAQVGTYEGKVAALNRLKEGTDPIEQSNVPNQVLYNMMRYYLALKLMRNRINHASETDKEDDEKNAIEQIEKFHGLSMEIDFQNVKTMIQNGLNSHKEKS